MPPRVLIEICVDSVEACLAAAEGGADRLELCAGLVEGGTTPSAGTLALALEKVRIPIVVLVRPRRGDFHYTNVELETMKRDVLAAKAAGAAGVAVGALERDGTVSRFALRTLVAAARPMSVTFHRAFDHVVDPLRGLETLVEHGVERVLTSGGAATAPEGAERIAELVRAARGRITILAGGGVRPENVRALVRATGVDEVHATARRLVESAMEHRPDEPRFDSDPIGLWELQATRAERVRALRAAL
ncbi:MAG: copper homeostasis protein CutC [Planctomycetes bacterium]|nr:copper homeostasis protein CutC [Planctomycetota bacterium]